MKIQCDNCGTKFDLNEALLKPEGSKVRCSVCKHVFTAYPPEPKDIAPAETETPEPQRPETWTAIPPAEEGLEGEGAERAGEAAEERVFAPAEERPPETKLPEEPEFERPPEGAGRHLEETGPEEEAPPQPEAAEEPGYALPGRERAAEAEAVAERAAEEKGAEPEAGRRRSRLWLVLLILLLVAAGAVAAVFYFRPAEQAEAPDPGVRRLAFESVTSSFVASKNAGLLFVIRGLVRNNYPDDRSHIRVKASILDDRGQVVKQRLAYAGNTYKEEELKVLPLAEIQAAMDNRSGMDNANRKVAPGATVPFMIAFANFPDNLSEFTVEAVGSSPAAPR